MSVSREDKTGSLAFPPVFPLLDGPGICSFSVCRERDWVSSDQRHICKPSLWSPHACYDSDVFTSHKWSTNNYYNNDNNKIQLGKNQFYQCFWGSEIKRFIQSGKLAKNFTMRMWLENRCTLLVSCQYYTFLGSYQNAHKAVRVCPYENNHFLGSPTRPALWASTVRLHDLTRVLERKKNKLEWKVENNFQVTDRVFIVLAFLAISLASVRI